MSNDRDPAVRRFADEGFGVASDGQDPRYQPSVRRAPEPAVMDDEWRPVRPRSTESSHAASAAATGAPEAQVVVDDANVVTFLTAYENNGESIRSVRFNKPTTAHLRRIGYPFRQIIDPSTNTVVGMDVLADRVARYVAEVSTPRLLPSTIDRMDFEDFEGCSAVITGFFMRSAK